MGAHREGIGSWRQEVVSYKGASDFLFQIEGISSGKTKASYLTQEKQLCVKESVCVSVCLSVCVCCLNSLY